MIIPMRTVNQALLLSVDVVMPADRPRQWFPRLRAQAIHELRRQAAAVADFTLQERDIVFEPTSRTAWRCQWRPTGCSAELWGGPKDGMILALPSARQRIEFRQIAPDWRQHLDQAGGHVRTVTHAYEVSGWNAATSATVYAYTEGGRP